MAEPQKAKPVGERSVVTYTASCPHACDTYRLLITISRGRGVDSELEVTVEHVPMGARIE